jgi:HupE/UreJ protein
MTMRAVLLLLLALFLASPVQAHEVRPAYLEISARPDGRADVLWKQPRQGEVAIHLVPHLDGLIDRAPDKIELAQNFEVRRWSAVDLGGRGLEARQVRVDGLQHTITDVLLLVRLKDGDQISQILTPAASSFRIDARAGAAVPAYLKLGIEHILTGFDHLLFVFGLMLLSDRLGKLVKTITAFTIAHSITLGVTALKFVSPDPQLIEALVALSILFLAVELVRKGRGEISLTTRYPWLIAFGFGLLHGAAFAGSLKEIGLPEGNVLAALFLFNVGVETGQLLFVGIVGGTIALAARARIPTAAPALARMAAVYGIGAASTFWFLERLHTALA